MDQDLKKQLKKFREIEPDESFLRKSRVLILSLEKEKRVIFFGSHVTAWAMSFAVVFLLILGYLFIPARSGQVPIASAEALNKELNAMNINIALSEVSYNNQINQTINKTLSAVTSNAALHLNPDILQSESLMMASMTVAGNGSQVDDLLNQVLQ